MGTPATIVVGPAPCPPVGTTDPSTERAAGGGTPAAPLDPDGVEQPATAVATAASVAAHARRRVASTTGRVEERVDDDRREAGEHRAHRAGGGEDLALAGLVAVPDVPGDP